MEYMRPNMRTFGLNLCIGIFYCLGCVVVPWIALVTGHWRTFLWGISAPMIVVPGFYFILPESARWLINKGRLQEAVICFNRIAAVNGRPHLPQSAVDKFKVN